MKRTLITIALTTVVVLTLMGIVSSSLMFNFASPSASRDAGYGGGGAPEVLSAPAAEAPMPDSFVSVDAGKSDQTVNNSIPAQQDRLVIQNADLAIVVKDPKARMKEINDLANELGGFVVSSNLSQSYTSAGVEVPAANITIRVPSEKLDEALEKIKAGAVDVTYENRSGQDVTSQYVDLQSQLKAKQAAEKKLLEILDQAIKTEDVLAVYTQLQQIQSEIEVLKGQIKYYEESAALSAISVNLIAEAGIQPIEIGPWKPEGAAKEAIQNLILFAQHFADFLIGFVLFALPALILIAIPLLIVYAGGRALFRRFRKSNEKAEPKEVVKK